MEEFITRNITKKVEINIQRNKGNIKIKNNKKNYII